MTLRAALAAAILALPLPAQAAEVPPGSALFFGIHWIDTSTEGAINGTRPDEAARIAMIEAQIAADLTQRGFTLTAPAPEEVARIRNPVHCNGCDTKMAAEKGLDYAITGEIQKVSNLILNINVYVKPLKDGAPEQAYSVDLRGNTDESFDRGIRFLVENNMGAGK